ncbi:MAG: hypothetical protein ACRD2E_02015 [Terriglobales bacterium]
MRVHRQTAGWMAGLVAAVIVAAMPAWGQALACGGPGEPLCPQAPQYGVAPAIHLPPGMAYRQKKQQAELRQRKLKQASAKLFVLAQQLRIAVGKTNENTLSLGVIRKAKQIEKLAKQIQDIMSSGRD